MIIDILKKIGLLFVALVALYIGISVLITIYTYINMRLRTGNFIEGFEVKSYNSENMLNKNDISSKVYNLLSKKDCLAETKNNLIDYNRYDITNSEEINDCPTVNAQTPFVGILQTSYNCDNDVNFYR